MPAPEVACESLGAVRTERAASGKRENKGTFARLALVFPLPTYKNKYKRKGSIQSQRPFFSFFYHRKAPSSVGRRRHPPRGHFRRRTWTRTCRSSRVWPRNRSILSGDVQRSFVSDRLKMHRLSRTFVLLLSILRLPGSRHVQSYSPLFHRFKRTRFIRSDCRNHGHRDIWHARGLFECARIPMDAIPCAWRISLRVHMCLYVPVHLPTVAT